ncbi:hypothetical protein JSE7799_00276 [Jannaschia seosinensis]|uniref:Uncharacterized protein n=1 Tax=Jannaschia seosinensis TaxID=313367 RepID=A0A0M7B5H9_9RHOB|nr:hypothetical protein JSE7799_00276 [Jannaschia seosinensis]
MFLLRLLGLVSAKGEPRPLPIDPEDGLYKPRPPITGRTGPRPGY